MKKRILKRREEISFAINLAFAEYNCIAISLAIGKYN